LEQGLSDGGGVHDDYELDIHKVTSPPLEDLGRNNGIGDVFNESPTSPLRLLGGAPAEMIAKV